MHSRKRSMDWCCSFFLLAQGASPVYSNVVRFVVFKSSSNHGCCEVREHDPVAVSASERTSRPTPADRTRPRGGGGRPTWMGGGGVGVRHGSWHLRCSKARLMNALGMGAQFERIGATLHRSREVRGSSSPAKPLLLVLRRTSNKSKPLTSNARRHWMT